jgi:hypothetical protein
MSPAALIAILLAVPVVLASMVLTDAGGVILLLVYGVPGLVLAVRRPGQPIAWLLLLMGIGLMFGTIRVTATPEQLLTGDADALGRFTAWANGTGWVLVFAGFIGLAVVFPGRSWPPGPWGRVARLVVVAFVPIAVVLLLGPIVNVTVSGYPSGADVPNPFALPVLRTIQPLLAYNAVLWACMFALAVVATLALLDRFRRSTGIERLQYRWLAWAVVLFAAGSGAWAVVVSNDRAPGAISIAIMILPYPAIPLAVMIAVLRHRLYEIDRLVSRTLGWGLATTAVLALFVVAVFALQTVLAGLLQGQVLAVAAATLLAFAVFQPVRARVQAFVDRHFDRPRLEAERSLAAYGERLQHEVDLDAVTRDVEETVVGTLRPSVVSLWIRSSRSAGP